MSAQEVQTAAARVFHVDRINDTALEILKSRYHYHPHDVEAIFSTPKESSLSTYGQYCYLTILWPDVLTGDTVSLQIFIDQHQLSIIGDTSDHAMRQIIERLQSPTTSSEAQLSAPELVHSLVQELRRTWQNHEQQLTSSSQHQLYSAAQVIRQFGRWLLTNHLTAAVEYLILDAHALDGLADRLSHQTEQPKEKSLGLPFFLRGYAFASALMVIVVIVTLARQ